MLQNGAAATTAEPVIKDTTTEVEHVIKQLDKLVEVVKTIATTQDVVDELFEFAKTLGKEPILAKDTTGFVVNRLLVPYLLDAIRAYEEGVGSIEDIDNAMKLGCGYPMGPFTLLDFVGLDTTYYITHVMYDEFKERRFASPPLLKRLVMAGWYGKKSGKGFYDYSNPEKPVKANTTPRPSVERPSPGGSSRLAATPCPWWPPCPIPATPPPVASLAPPACPRTTASSRTATSPGRSSSRAKSCAATVCA